MITLTDVERSVIARLEPGQQQLTVTNRNGGRTTARDDLQPWLHLFHHDHVITPAWFADTTRLALNIPSYCREPVEKALTDLIGNPGHVAVIIWEQRQRLSRGEQPYGDPEWLPSGHRLIAYEPGLQEATDAL